MGRLAHNKAVQNQRNNDHDAKAQISVDDYGVDIAIGHIDGLSFSDERDYVEQIEDELNAELDKFAVCERGGDGVGYAKVRDGEFVGWKLYANYQR